MSRYLNRLIKTVARTKGKVDTQTKQRRGGVTDLYALDYQSNINNKGIWGYGYNGLSAGDEPTQTTPGTAPVVGKDIGVGTTTERIKKLAQVIKREVPSATDIGIAGVVGNFGIESDVTAERYEADFATSNRYDLMRQEPTAENLVGSWGTFLSLYGGGLNEQGYLAGGKHWIGIGLGQWTGPRGKALFDFAKANGSDIFSFDTQVKFMLTEPGLSQTFKDIVSLNTSVEDSTTRFLAEWEGVPGNKLAQRIQYANDNIALVREGMGLAGTPDPATPTTDLQADPNGNFIPIPVKTDAKTSATYRVLVPADLDRFQRWFIKIIVVSEVNEEDSKYNIMPLAGATLSIQAVNQKTGETINRDVTEILKHKHPCDWVGSSTDSEAVYPNEDPLEGYDIMDLAWYLNEEERNALFSAGEKLFTIKALGKAKVTLRNFLKFSHIN